MRNERVLYEFDDIRIDSGQFVLIRRGRPQPITPTVFRILLVLLENAGQVVSKEDLMSKVWSDSFVEDGNLNRNVSTLRKALGETPRDHRYVETVSKTGYRFVAPVRRSEFQPVAGKASMPNPARRKLLLGRDSERTCLDQAFIRMKDGSGSVVCLSGEAGIGKTAIVDTFIAELAERGETFHLSRTRCSEPLTQPEAYGPFLESLSTLSKSDALAESIRNHAPTWSREMTRTSESQSPAVFIGGRMKREMLELLPQMSLVHPVVVVIDDFHWADIASVDLLAFLAARVSEMRVLVIACMRPAELLLYKHSYLQALVQLLGSGTMSEVMVPPLSRKDLQEYVVSEYPEMSNPADVAALVMARTEGNPLFMIEVLRCLKQDATFSKRQDAVPDSLRALIKGWLEPLDEPARGLLAAASVQGYEFDSAILSKSLGMKPEDVEARLKDICENHALIQHLRDEELLDGKYTVRYRFTHALCQSICHESLTPTRKASLNSAVAEAFLAYYGS